ncbi:MAG TPA: hypothetical protein VMX55_07315 [candidate division Zixibacteria bacterium]|nr:hypothetical protein [candidate division Zixibacteria bacterium]
MRNGRNNNEKGRHRNLFKLTGTPGWIRFGKSPSYAGGGFGRGPCAEFIEKTGQMEEFVKDLTEKNPNYSIWQDSFSNMKKLNTDFEKEQIESRIRSLENELKNLKKELKEFR